MRSPSITTGKKPASTSLHARPMAWSSSPLRTTGSGSRRSITIASSSSSSDCMGETNIRVPASGLHSASGSWNGMAAGSGSSRRSAKDRHSTLPSLQHTRYHPRDDEVFRLESTCWQERFEVKTRADRLSVREASDHCVHGQWIGSNKGRDGHDLVAACPLGILPDIDDLDGTGARQIIRAQVFEILESPLRPRRDTGHVEFEY